MNDVPHISQSDKFYWHRYIPFYELHFADRDYRNILEFGVFRGDSIRWLVQRFPRANICGVDIMDVQPEWPSNERVTYAKLDQADKTALRRFFEDKEFDLIIEDGSHAPSHQANCLIEGLKHVSTGGLYIVEDIHTSLPGHPYYRASQKRRVWFRQAESLSTTLSTLLAIDHLKRVGAGMNDELAQEIAGNGLLSADEVTALFCSFGQGWLYRRTSLPDRCFRCGSRQYDYRTFKCSCGVDIFSSTDSMSFIVQKAGD